MGAALGSSASAALVSIKVTAAKMGVVPACEIPWHRIGDAPATALELGCSSHANRGRTGVTAGAVFLTDIRRHNRRVGGLRRRADRRDVRGGDQPGGADQREIDGICRPVEMAGMRKGGSCV